MGHYMVSLKKRECMHNQIVGQVKRILADEKEVDESEYKNLGSAYYDLGPVLIVFNTLSHQIRQLTTCITCMHSLQWMNLKIKTQVTCSTNSDGSWLRPEFNPGLNFKSLFFSLHCTTKRNGECLAALEKEWQVYHLGKGFIGLQRLDAMWLWQQRKELM